MFGKPNERQVLYRFSQNILVFDLVTGVSRSMALLPPGVVPFEEGDPFDGKFNLITSSKSGRLILLRGFRDDRRGRATVLIVINLADSRHVQVLVKDTKGWDIGGSVMLGP